MTSRCFGSTFTSTFLNFPSGMLRNSSMLCIKRFLRTARRVAWSPCLPLKLNMATSLNVVLVPFPLLILSIIRVFSIARARGGDSSGRRHGCSNALNHSVDNGQSIPTSGRALQGCKRAASRNVADARMYPSGCRAYTRAQEVSNACVRHASLTPFPDVVLLSRKS
jgi:hypothetical protein